MNTLFFLAFFLMGIGLSTWPPFARKLSSFFDTVVHEAGHGISSLPFGTPLPAITVRKNSSGETLSSMGYLHQLLPLGFGKLTEKIARLLSLMAGYSASIILGSVLLVLALTEKHSFQPWVIAFVAQVTLATMLWTMMRLSENPWSFVFMLCLATGFYLWLLPWDLWIYLGALAATLILALVAKMWLSSLATLLTLSSIFTIVLGIMDPSNEIWSLFGEGELTLTSHELSKIIFATLFIFVLFCCRSWLSGILAISTLGSILGLLFIPAVNYSYVLTSTAAVLFSSGVRSFLELGRITFNTRGFSRDIAPRTDMVFAAEELGGDPRYWYWFTSILTVFSSAAILYLGYFIHL